MFGPLRRFAPALSATPKYYHFARIGEAFFAAGAAYAINAREILVLSHR
jgi:hypothetical protein